jgi:hypothetical protein
MQTWSDTFRAYIERRFDGDRAQQKAADALVVSPSAVSYWCRGSVPRVSTQERIAEWSGGEVPVAERTKKGAAESGPKLETDEHSAVDETGTEG